MSNERKENFILASLLSVVVVSLAASNLFIKGSAWVAVLVIVAGLWVWFTLWLLEGGAVAKAKATRARSARVIPISPEPARYSQEELREGDVQVVLVSPDGDFLVLSPEDRMGPYLEAGYRKVKLYTD